MFSALPRWYNLHAGILYFYPVALSIRADVGKIKRRAKHGKFDLPGPVKPLPESLCSGGGGGDKELTSCIRRTDKRGWTVIRHGRRGESGAELYCADGISLPLNCALPSVNSEKHFSAERRSKSSRLLNDRGPDGTAKPLLKSYSPTGRHESGHD